ncbi:SAM-dependent methyltransferase [Phyllobacterium ifriqiyense]|uniref:SAM-dependent methyltransferase n=1 Tax=Phyllobacterium ifriqiyense TaxID=314238 RepID=A0ABU0SBF0_9HYPH|nr:class I SAM-dependent methyltransferase [Phyllobacterium ifriqiyense]MDQ0998071.1 SAM-dependent methyltransferase [Phyllobacterium ifriqiyense]
MDSFIGRILASADAKDGDLPGFPPPEVQARFVGRSGRDALSEVLPFVSLIQDYSLPSNSTQVLDFGCGWGRIARFFQNSVDAEALKLADVDPEALNWCKDSGVKGTRYLLEPTGKLPFDNNSIDVAYSYSVFSHLSEVSAVHWLNELHRALRPNGILIFTTQSMRFLQLVLACNQKTDPSAMEASIGTYMGRNPQRSVEQFQSGQHAYSDVNGLGGGGMLSGDFYGWAAIPQKWFENHFRWAFHVEEYIDDPAVLEQAVYVARKK